jgi:hypothetical protein
MPALSSTMPTMSTRLSLFSVERSVRSTMVLQAQKHTDNIVHAVVQHKLTDTIRCWTGCVL